MRNKSQRRKALPSSNRSKKVADSPADLIAARNERSHLKGERLINWLLQEARRRGFTARELAKAVGISRSYLFGLRYGDRRIDALSTSVLKRCADFLNTPMLVVLMAAEIVKVDYFTVGTREKILGEISRGLEFVAADPNFGALLPDVRSMDIQTKYFVIFAYEQATGRSLLSSDVNIQAVRDLTIE